MKINKDLEVALKALMVLKTSSSVMRVLDIATQIGSTAFFLEQVIRKLRIAKMVEVKRGPGGGYTSSFKTYTAMDIANALGYTFESVGEINTPEYVLSQHLISAFQNTFV